MSFSKEAAVGFFVMLGLVCVAYLTVKLGRMEVFHSEGYVLTASFNSVSGLRPGAEVEIAGVRVGRVKSIRLDDKQPRAVVELQLGDNVHLTDDVIASVKTSGLIGDKYISLEPGGSGEPLNRRWILKASSASMCLGRCDYDAYNQTYGFGVVQCVYPLRYRPCRGISARGFADADRSDFECAEGTQL